jgi:hypothetical protein
MYVLIDVSHGQTSKRQATEILMLILRNFLARFGALRLIFQRAIRPALFARKANDADAAPSALILASRAFPRVVDGYRRARAQVRAPALPAAHRIFAYPQITVRVQHEAVASGGQSVLS